MRSGKASTRRGIHWWPFGCSSRTEPSTTIGVDVETVRRLRRRAIAGSLVRMVIASPPTAACSAAGVSSAASSPRCMMRDAVGPLGLFQQVRGEHDGDAVLVADLLKYCHRSLRAPGSRPVDGSSSNNSRGRCSMPLANSTRRRRPPESFSTRSRLRSARPSRVEHFVGPSAQLAAAQAVQPAVMDDVFQHGELLVDAGRLKDDAELRANRVGSGCASRSRGCARRPAGSESASRARGRALSCRCRWGPGWRRFRRVATLSDRSRIAWWSP